MVAGAETLYTYDDTDLLRLDGDPAIGGLRILQPPAEPRQTTLGLAAGEAAPTPDETSDPDQDGR